MNTELLFVHQQLDDFKSSCAWCRVVWWVFTNIWGERIAYILRFSVLSNISKHVPNDTMPCPRRLHIFISIAVRISYLTCVLVEFIDSSVLLFSLLIFSCKICSELDEFTVLSWFLNSWCLQSLYFEHLCALAFKLRKGEGVALMITGILLVPGVFVCVIQHWLLQLNKSIVTMDLDTLAGQLRKTANEIPRNADVSFWFPKLFKIIL